MSCHVMSRPVPSRPVPSRHVMCHVMSCHVMSCRVMSCHVMSCHVMSCHVMSRVVIRVVTSCHVMSCHVTSCHVTVTSLSLSSRHVTSRHVTSCVRFTLTVLFSVPSPQASCIGTLACFGQIPTLFCVAATCPRVVHAMCTHTTPCGVARPHLRLLRLWLPGSPRPSDFGSAKSDSRTAPRPLFRPSSIQAGEGPTRAETLMAMQLRNHLGTAKTPSIKLFGLRETEHLFLGYESSDGVRMN